MTPFFHTYIKYGPNSIKSISCLQIDDETHLIGIASLHMREFGE